MTQAECAEEGGEWLGPDTECPEFPTGACILPDESCEILTECACFEAGGAWLGAGIPCPQPTCYYSGATGTFTGGWLDFMLGEWFPFLLENCTLIEGFDAYFAAAEGMIMFDNPTWVQNDPVEQVVTIALAGMPGEVNWIDWPGSWSLGIDRCEFFDPQMYGADNTFREARSVWDDLIIARRAATGDPTQTGFAAPGQFDTTAFGVLVITWRYSCCEIL